MARPEKETQVAELTDELKTRKRDDTLAMKKMGNHLLYIRGGNSPAQVVLLLRGDVLEGAGDLLAAFADHFGVAANRFRRLGGDDSGGLADTGPYLGEHFSG